MLRSKSLVGKTVAMNNSQKATRIEHRGYEDLDVRFEDGTIVRHKRMWFLR